MLTRLSRFSKQAEVVLSSSALSLSLWLVGAPGWTFALCPVVALLVASMGYLAREVADRTESAVKGLSERVDGLSAEMAKRDAALKKAEEMLRRHEDFLGAVKLSSGFKGF